MRQQDTLKSQKIPSRLRRRLLFATIGFWLPALIFIKLAQEVLERKPILVDMQIIDVIQSGSAAWLTNTAKLLTHGGDSLTIALATALLVCGLLYYSRRRDALAVLFAVGGAGVINYILKLFFQRARPDAITALVHENSFSFPSGHAMGSSALAFALIIMLWRTKWRWFAVVIGALCIPLIGFTRVYLGAHYPSDIIAGWCVSAIWVVTVYIALEHPLFIKRHI